MNINTHRLTTEFIELVSIDSPSFGEQRVGNYIRQNLKALGFEVREDNAGAGHDNGCGNIYGYLAGNNGEKEPLLFCAHMDTVEPANGKHAVLDDGGVIKSAGDTVLGADDFAGIVAILEALRVIRENGIAHRPIEVLFTVAEEVYCGGIAQLDFSWIKSRQAYVLDLAGPVGTAANKAPSILFFTATVAGKSAHAGFEPQNGIHAIAAAAKAVSALRLGQVDGETTLNVGVIEGGRATNIVPDRCVVRGEARSFTHSKAEAQLEEVRHQFEAAAAEIGATVEFEVFFGCEAYETPLDHPVAKRFEKACGAVGLSPAFQPTLGGSDNNYLAQHGIVGLVAAPGMHLCHTCEEYTTADDLVRSARLALALMAASDGEVST